ncbi:MAG: 1,4-dihydroxy-2-naphthoate polyprenyltransferase [Propionibacteriaceae bacterium]|jgi:1,4-dihydroxy-2-naphthoate octaprenyltransferase|nr:1,4-dihydroxy-2-naphthoate polyprenyltransferase [Propionibacteriaceae bacterium]
MATGREWLAGARPRTLPASAAPVVAGTGVAWFASPAPPPFGDHFQVMAAVVAPLLCLVVGLAFQIGGNLANDYSDGVRGTDAHRVGPARLVGSGAAAPRAVKRAAWLTFGTGCLAGLIAAGLALAAEPAGRRWLVFGVFVVAGVACVLAAWFYTGGRHPYGYAGLGEVFVFIFFGLVATVGTTYLVAPRTVPWVPAIVMGAVTGCFAMAILVANNLRDLATDQAAGKITLAVRLGDAGARRLYVALIAAAAGGLVVTAGLTTWVALAGLVGFALLVTPVARVVRGATGRELIHVLARTGQSELVAVLFTGLGLGLGWCHG